jgi:hypothetical protein
MKLYREAISFSIKPASRGIVTARPMGSAWGAPKGAARKAPRRSAAKRRCLSSQSGSILSGRISAASSVRRRTRSVSSWIDAEFSTVDLGDLRRERRLKKVTERMGQAPGASQRGAAEDWTGAMGSYRLWEASSVTAEAIFASNSPSKRRKVTAGWKLRVEPVSCAPEGRNKSIGQGKWGDVRFGFRVRTSDLLRISELGLRADSRPVVLHEPVRPVLIGDVHVEDG